MPEFVCPYCGHKEEYMTCDNTYGEGDEDEFQCSNCEKMAWVLITEVNVKCESYKMED